MTPSSKALLVAALALTLTACAGRGGKKPRAAKEAPVAAQSSSKPTKAEPEAEAKEPDTSKSPEEQFTAAMTAYKAKNFAEARKGFEALAKSHPELSGPLSNLGILDAKQGKREAAIGNFSRAVVANPENAMAYNWLGQLYRETKAYPEAEKAYLRAIKVRSGYAQPELNLGILYDVYLNRPGEALVRYRNYQELTGSKDLKVTAWIKALEARGVVPPSAPTPAPAPTPTKPSSAKGKKA